MNPSDGQLITSAIRFASRFGFLTRDIFFKYLCVGSRAHQYRKWNLLLKEGWFVPYGSDPLAVYLSKKSKNIFSLNDVKARSPFFINHDSVVAEIFLTFKKTGLVVGSWTEAELSRQRWDAFSITGTDTVDKLPDLILDLKTSGENLRVAVEVEMSRKSRNRYSHVALCYLEMNKIDLVIYACSRELLAVEIKRAFRDEAFSNSQKAPGIFLISDFQEQHLDAAFSYSNTNYTIQSFLAAATKMPVNVGENTETAVSENSKEVAS